LPAALLVFLPLPLPWHVAFAFALASAVCFFAGIRVMLLVR
jgi:hypothetical protein